MEQSRKGDCKMKKFLALVCMITCIFGLTACGSEEELTAYEQQKVTNACEIASTSVVDVMMQFTDEVNRESLSDFTVEELEEMLYNFSGLKFEGYAFLNAVESFNSGIETIGSIVAIGEPTAKIDDDQIIVNVPITGALKDAEAEVILSNDMFYVVESASLNPVSTMGDLMVKAALNTLIGMGTVFVVLILISLIIYCFAFIPKIQATFSKKKEEPKAVVAEKPAAPVVEEDLTDDLELVAVIAAAIAASEGAASTDGFVVRSIRKVNRNRR